jgi:hypothetical protein
MVWDACPRTSLTYYDSRAFSPEITVRSMLERKGMAFIDFLTDFCNGKTDLGMGNIYFLPSEWWQQVRNMSDDPNIETTFPFLSHSTKESVYQ